MDNRAYLPRARWYRSVLDWLQWHGPLWLARRIPNWGIYWVYTDVDARMSIGA